MLELERVVDEDDSCLEVVEDTAMVVGLLDELEL